MKNFNKINNNLFIIKNVFPANVAIKINKIFNNKKNSQLNLK